MWLTTEKIMDALDVMEFMNSHANARYLVQYLFSLPDCTLLHNLVNIRIYEWDDVTKLRLHRSWWQVDLLINLKTVVNLLSFLIKHLIYSSNRIHPNFIFRNVMKATDVYRCHQITETNFIMPYSG